MAVLRVAIQVQVQAGGVESSTHVTFEWREIRAGRGTSANTKVPTGVIDSDGYRPNVGIVLVNRRSEVLWARRVGQKAWQFPQGGIKVHETPEQAMFRELFEEIGLGNEHVEVMGSTRGWLRYTLPRRYIRRRSNPVCIGQKQVWFLLRMVGQDSAVRLDGGENPEFDHWKWVDYWYPSQEVIFFKREVYRRALKELAPLLDLFPTLPGNVQ